MESTALSHRRSREQDFTEKYSKSPKDVEWRTRGGLSLALTRRREIYGAKSGDGDAGGRRERSSETPMRSKSSDPIPCGAKKAESVFRWLFAFGTMWERLYSVE